MIDQSIAMGQRQWGNRSNCNGNGALGNWGNSCNSNGNGATATAKRGNGDGDRSVAIAMALGHRSRGNRTVIAMGQRGVGGDVYVVLQRKTSTIVVDETVQNAWTAIIRDVLGWNKTCMISCSGILFGVSYLYWKVELVNAFRINSSLKWSKLYSNRVSNIISECS
jgi:hypothetical protein